MKLKIYDLMNELDMCGDESVDEDALRRYRVTNNIPTAWYWEFWRVQAMSVSRISTI